MLVHFQELQRIFVYFYVLLLYCKCLIMEWLFYYMFLAWRQSFIFIF